ILKNIEDITLEHIKIKTPSHDKGIWVDLMTGQKTGFFLDQSFNVQLVLQILKKSALMQLSEVKILDLFSYAGQWGTALGSIFPSQNVTICAADASELALNFAKENLNIYNLANTIIKCDLLKDFASLEQAAFDVVICDPPALIKSRKHIFTGQKGYLKLNTDALKCVKPGGFFMTCSCSRLLSENDFFEILNHASIKAKRSIQWIGRGVQSPDHPILASFPEGQYLKCWIGVVSMSNY
ncbi:MAG: methyltransferase, partial [Bdellovibrio sp.]|nr:methyltransferase [Bdellovibrio sp.]